MNISTGSGERYGESLFRPTHSTERARLKALADSFDAASVRFLTALGVRQGWQCLDAGAGLGTVTRWLAEQVGPLGQVTACDLDTRYLTESPHPQVEVLAANLTSGDVSPGQFDLVHARFLLMHLPERDTTLTRLASWVRPGGYLVVSDAADLATSTSSRPAYRQTMAAMQEFLANTIGTDINYGLRHRDALAGLGLSEIALSVDLPTLVHRSAWTDFWTLTLEQTSPGMISSGLITPRTVQETLNYLASPDLCELSLAMITTCGRKTSP